MADIQPPELVGGRYRPDSVLGRSQRSVTMLATRVDLDQTVVLKILDTEEGASPDAAKRFAREIKATATIQHPNVVAVFDAAATDDGRAYFVMEYVEGQPLQKVLADAAPLDPARVVHITRQLCAGVAAAHTAGVAHRDLNPKSILVSNMVGKPDFVTVMHFAIAKIIGADPATRLTMAGAVLGDASYSAPEMADPAFDCPEGYHEAMSGDVYAIGCLAFEMLVGRPPLTHGSIMRQFMLRMRSKPDWPDDALGRIPAPIRSAVDAMLQSDIEQRPRTAVEALKMWTALVPRSSRRASGTGHPRRTPLPRDVSAPPRTPAPRAATTPIPRSRPTPAPATATARRPSKSPMVVARPPDDPGIVVLPASATPPAAAAPPRLRPRPTAPPRPGASRRPPSAPRPTSRSSKPVAKQPLGRRGLLMIGPDRTVMLLVQKVAGTTLVAKVLKRIDLQPGQEVVMTFPGPDGGRVIRGMAVAVKPGLRSVEVEVELMIQASATTAIRQETDP